jgi:hypothetical protein
MDSDTASSALDSTYGFWTFVLIWPLIALAILAFGWIEDLAAGRSPRLWPDGRRRGGARRATR